MLKGFLKCHKDRLHADPKNPRTIASNSLNERPKVGIVTGGGSGHKPAFIGYCGRNMVDAVAVGEIFSSPTAEAFEQCIRAVDQGLGVAVLYGNYAGDNMNVKMAKRAVEKDGIAVGLVVANDDVPSAAPTERDKRHGVAGELMMWKCGGVKAAMGASLDEVIACAQKAVDNTRSVGIGLGPAPSPPTASPTSTSSPAPWRSASSTTASPACAWSRSRAPTRWPPRWSTSSFPTCPSALATRSSWWFGDTLVKDIGGSMGPIYGTFFDTLADGLDVPEFDATDLKEAFADVVESLKDLAGAKEGDKTLIDTAAPASRAFCAALDEGKSLADALAALAIGAAAGLESTRGMHAKIGRAARLGQRSIGHLDAGATSCDVILETLANGLAEKL